MAMTMRKMLENIKKEIDKNPGLLDAPCVSVNSASGVTEAIYSPSVREADEQDIDYCGLPHDTTHVWSFSIDH